MWGSIADKYGRKPVMIFGIVCSTICMLVFGLSTSFFMALVSRFVLGMGNGKESIFSII